MQTPSFALLDATSKALTLTPLSTTRGKALIVIAGSVNYFYDVVGYRVAEALYTLGFEVKIGTPFSLEPENCDWVFFIDLYDVTSIYEELFNINGESEAGLRRIRQYRRRAKQAVVVLMECGKVRWFGYNVDLLQKARLDLLIDIGFHTQLSDVPAFLHSDYRFVLSGLTKSEREAAYQTGSLRSERPIPWAFIGHLQPRRAKFAQDLVTNLEKDGFVYLPHSLRVVEGGPHIGRQQLQTILERTRYYIWCSHHDYFYAESERFRNALLAGAVPIKVMDTLVPVFKQPLPFKYLMPDEADYVELLKSVSFESLRQRFFEDYCNLPSLEETLASAIHL